MADDHGADASSPSTGVEASSSVENIDAIFRKEGPYTRFHIFLHLGMIYLCLSISWNFILFIFTGFDAGWKCKNNNSSSFCNKNVNITFTNNNEHFNHRCNLLRSEWIFDVDTDHSFVTEFDLLCNQKPVAALIGAANYIGGIIGTLVIGSFSDNFGRKPVLFVSVLICCCFSIGGSYVTNPWQLFGINIAVGAGSIGGIFLLFPYLLEFVTPEYHSVSSAVLQISMVSSFLLADLIAYHIRYWRKLKLYTALPSVISLLIITILPESPRWLLSKGKLSQAKQVLKKILILNRSSNEIHSIHYPVTSLNKTYNYKDLFSNMDMSFLTLSIATIRLSLYVVYYTLIQSSPNIGGNMYQAFALSLIPDIFASAISPSLADRIGRKKTVFSGLLSTCVLLACMASIPYSLSYRYYINIALTMLAIFSCITALCCALTWTFEIFPTIVRAKGTSVCVMFDRIGILATPFIVRLSERAHFTMPFIIASVLVLITLLLGFKILPETNNLPTRETYEDFKSNMTDVASANDSSRIQEGNDNLESTA